MNHELKLVLALAALLGPGLAQAGAEAGAQTGIAAAWQVTQTGENFDGAWSGGPRDNMVGGGNVRMSGGGEDTETLYTGPAPSAAPVFARMSGGGDDMTVSYDVVPNAGRPVTMAEVAPAGSRS